MADNPLIKKLAIGGITYDIADAAARTSIANLQSSMTKALHFVGVSIGKLTDLGTEVAYVVKQTGIVDAYYLGSTAPTEQAVTIDSKYYTVASYTKLNGGDVFFYGKQEFVFSTVDNKWHELGAGSSLGALAYKNSATGMISVNTTHKHTLNVTAGAVTQGSVSGTATGSITIGTLGLAFEKDASGNVVSGATASVLTGVTPTTHKLETKTLSTQSVVPSYTPVTRTLTTTRATYVRIDEVNHGTPCIDALSATTAAYDAHSDVRVARVTGETLYLDNLRIGTKKVDCYALTGLDVVSGFNKISGESNAPALSSVNVVTGLTGDTAINVYKQVTGLTTVATGNVGASYSGGSVVGGLTSDSTTVPANIAKIYVDGQTFGDQSLSVSGSTSGVAVAKPTVTMESAGLVHDFQVDVQ